MCTGCVYVDESICFSDNVRSYARVDHLNDELRLITTRFVADNPYVPGRADTRHQTTQHRTKSPHFRLLRSRLFPDAATCWPETN